MDLNKEMEALLRKSANDRTITFMHDEAGPFTEVPGYCLAHDKETVFTAPSGVMGALYTCPYCGPIREPYDKSPHIFSPSEPLLERLKSRTVIVRLTTEQDIIDAFVEITEWRDESLYQLDEDYTDKVEELYNRAVDSGIIKDGDPPPWRKQYGVE